MKIIAPCLCCFLSITANTYAQNLVPNASFENYNNCIPGQNLMDTGSAYFPTIQNWMSASPVSPYLFSSCLGNVPDTHIYGYHQAHTGNGFAGITTCTQFAEEDTICHLCWNDRTYVQVQLTEPLKKDTQYCVEFYLACAVIKVNGAFYVSTARVGANLSVTRHQSHFAGGPSSLIRNLPAQVENAANNYITDTLHWQSVHGVYKAQGGEQWLTIGNFYNDSLTPVHLFAPAYANNTDSISDMLIDDVSVTTIPFPQLSGDTILCDSSYFAKTLYASPGGNYYQWSTGDMGQSITVHQPGVYWYNTDFGCGKMTDSIHIYFQPPLGGHLPADTNGCADIPLYLTIDSGFIHYTWSNGGTTGIIAVSHSGTYRVNAVYACGVFSDTVQVVIYPQPALPYAMDTDICINTGIFQAVVSGSNIHYYSSLSADTGSLLPPSIASASVTGYTFYTTQMANGCYSNYSIEQVNIIAPPQPDAINDVTLCQGETMQIGETNNRYHYSWSTGDTTNTILTDTGGIYTLTENNVCGTVIEQINVHQTNCSACLFVPNIFTPNGDGNNDVFKVFTNCPLKFYRCMIFDRIGQQVFESHNPTEVWDGTYRSARLGPAVFMYVITYVSANDDPETLKGSLILIR